MEVLVKHFLGPVAWLLVTAQAATQVPPATYVSIVNLGKIVKLKKLLLNPVFSHTWNTS